LIFSASSVKKRSTEAAEPSAGFLTKSTAPALMASIAFIGRELTTTTATGCCFISVFMNSMPLIFGISTSSVTTSGLSSRIFRSASSASTAVPTILMSGSLLSVSWIFVRNRTESSTARTRTGIFITSE